MSYLEEYLDKVQNLPIDVNRYLRLIKELDIRLNIVQIKLQDLQDSYLAQTKTLKEKKGDNRKLDTEKHKIERLQKESLVLAQEKMLIADQLYQSVDESIRELETDLKIFENELKTTNQAPILDQKETLSTKKKKKYDQKFITKTKDQRKQERIVNNALEKEKELITEWKPHPDEPKYCYCNKHSYGEMIKCDNDFCLQEWFHYDCTGITSLPKGKWYCKTCQPFKKSKLLN